MSKPARKARSRAAVGAIFLSVTVTLATACSGAANEPSAAPRAASPRVTAPTATPSVAPSTPAPATTAPSAPSAPSATSSATPSPRTPTSRPPRVTLADVTVTGIGDSIMDMSRDALRDRIPGMIVDAKVSRQMWTLDERITELLGSDRLGDVVVIGLGTNGTFQTSYLNEQLDRLGSARKIVLVDVDMPDSWESEVNRKLRSVAAARANVTIAGWHALVESDPDLLAPDDTHPTTRGSEEYAALIRGAILKALS